MKKPLVAGITVMSALLALTAGGAYYQKNVTKASHKLTISFPTASGLVPGSDVFEAGSKIGSISDIEPTVDNRALVTIQVSDEFWPLHQGLQAGIRPKSLLGEKYVDLHDGTSDQAFDISKTILAASESTPVELDQFINSLDADTRAAAKVLLNDLGAGVAGRGYDLNTAIQTGRENLANLAVTGQTLNNRDPDLDRILIGLDGVLQKIAANDQLTQMSQLIDNGQKVLNAIEMEKDSWSRSFNNAAKVLTELNIAFDSAVPNVRDLLNVAPHLLDQLKTESDLLAFQGSQVTRGDLLTVLTTGISHGPTASGGALEILPDGRALPIFRVCLPSVAPPPNKAENTACTGNAWGGRDLRTAGLAPNPSGSSGGMIMLAGLLGV
jgi:phospholipid/cholesterol/gamma-HCH transport system substrate-binding protein